jgi:CrcB protein
MDLTGCVLVLLGGFIGGTLRFAVSGVVARRVGETFPWGTLVVNVTGDFVIGGLAGLASAIGGTLATSEFRNLVIVGILGGYTTVSSFALQTLNLALDNERLRASFNVVLSVGLGLAMVGAGFWAAARFAA